MANPLNNMTNPWGIPVAGFPPFPVIPGRRRSRLKRIDTFELPTTGVQLSDTSVDYGINPCLYNELPCECQLILKIRQAVPAGGENLSITVVTPTAGSGSTVTSSGSTTGTQKTPVIDHNSNTVVGNDVSQFTDVLALLDKSLGIIRFVNFVSGGTTASSSNTPATPETPATASSKAKANS